MNRKKLLETYKKFNSSIFTYCSFDCSYVDAHFYNYLLSNKNFNNLYFFQDDLNYFYKGEYTKFFRYLIKDNK